MPHLSRGVCAVLALFLPACATAIRGPNVELNVVTEPPGAVVKTAIQTADSERAERRFLRKKYRGRLDPDATYEREYYGCSPTPCSFEMSRRAEFTLHVERDGYHPATVEITSGFGRGGGGKAAAGAAAGATGAYLATYAVASTMASTVATLATLGTTTASSTGAASAATTGAAGVGLLFLGVDLASGAMLDLRPNPVALVLVPDDQPLPESDSVLIETEAQLEEVRNAIEAGVGETESE